MITDVHCNASIAQLVRARGCEPQGRELEPHWERICMLSPLPRMRSHFLALLV